MEVAHMWLFFSFIYDNCTYPCVYVDWYTCVGDSPDIRECGLYPKLLATLLLFIPILLFTVLILFLFMDSLCYSLVLHLAILWTPFYLIMLTNMQITRCLES